jgi:hypothetical protein
MRHNAIHLQPISPWNPAVEVYSRQSEALSDPMKFAPYTITPRPEVKGWDAFERVIQTHAEDEDGMCLDLDHELEGQRSR